jgi:hypothetical protein
VLDVHQIGDPVAPDPALAQGCPLSEAFTRAQTLTDPGLLLIAKRDFRLTSPFVDSVVPLANA